MVAELAVVCYGGPSRHRSAVDNSVLVESLKASPRDPISETASQSTASCGLRENLHPCVISLGVLTGVLNHRAPAGSDDVFEFHALWRHPTTLQNAVLSVNSETSSSVCRLL